MEQISKVTMAHVARKAGVSRSAVAAALSDRPTTVGLNPLTRAQIQRVAQELGYRPNILSRSFIKQQSYLIGMIGRETSFLFALETIKGIEQVIYDTDYSLLTFYQGSWAEDQTKHLRKVLSRRVDGLIIIAAPERRNGPNHQAIKQMQASGTPIVQIYRDIFPNVPVVMVDEERVGYLATRHLIELGHRRIAHVTYSGFQDEELPGTNMEARGRSDGYRLAMDEAGLNPTIFAFERNNAVGPLDYTEHCAVAARHLVDALPRFTAATTFNDYTAIGLIHNLNMMNIRVPQDISIIGYDNTEASMLTRPALATMHPKVFDIGRIAGEMILKMKAGEAVQNVLLDPELVVRGSTAPPEELSGS